MINKEDYVYTRYGYSYRVQKDSNIYVVQTQKVSVFLTQFHVTCHHKLALQDCKFQTKPVS